MRLQDKLKKLREQKSAILATNFYNYETLQGVLTAAKETDSPIILQLTQSSIDYMSLPVAVRMVRAAVAEFGIEAWVHLDHGGSVELAKKCLDAGFDSVMIDASEETLENNIKITRQVVKYAELYGASVEAELGYIAKLGQDKNKLGFTEPEDVKRFVEETGVNSLAVSIGSAHGFYTHEPKLDMERLSAIRKVTDAALVLHGSSGIPHDQLQEAINRGICKINLATEIKNIFMQTLKKVLEENQEIDLRKVFPKATNEVVDIVKEKLKVVKNKFPVPSSVENIN
ncbi:MAG: class II fructose-bisphosphate aldolase [Cytophagaceae bacterium]|nr:class II fructose-bisphosphate aldolase [Cytophagaceae bacterium]